MFEFVLALARILVEVPCMVVSSRDSDENSCLSIGLVERCYEHLSEFEKSQVAGDWQLFQSIVVRQNEVYRDAVELRRELLRRIVHDLMSRDDES